MIKKAPIYELIIDEDDELSGVEKLSLVKLPANKYQYRVFDEDEEPHDCSRHLDFTNDALKMFDKVGENIPTEVLIQGDPVEMDLTFQDFASPNPTSSPSQIDMGYDNPEGDFVKRYVYVVDTGEGAPLISTSREMCRKLIRAQKVYRREDLINLSRQLEALGQESFKYVFRKRGLGVDVFQYKFGKNDRHCWRQLEFYKKPNESFDDLLSGIPNNSRRAIGKADAIIQGAERPFISEARYLRASDDRQKPIGFHFGLFIYKDRFSCMMGEPDTKKMSKVKVGDMEGWVGAEVMDSYFEGTGKVLDTFNVREMFVKVPEYIREVAKRVVDYTQENGWGGCGTQVGKTRANDLADPNYDASLDILTRMYSYGSRHKVDWESSKDYETGCGFKMMGAWGFSPSNYDEAMSWLERQMESGTEMSVQFSSDEYKGDITAVVFEPDQYIYRWDDEKQKPYYVFMSRDTIRKMLMKVSRLKPKDFINLEHTDKVFDGNEVYTYENWLVSDNPKEDKSYEIFGREMKPGTWITTIHFKNKELFNNFILSNKTSGVSLEGLFQEIPFNFAEVGEKGGIKESKKAPKSDTPNTDPKGEGTAKGDASTTRGAKVDKQTEETLKNKSDDWNERYKESRGYGVNVGMLKSVYQRGLGAFNTSHSPNVSSAKQWAMARVNAFLYLVKNGRPENKKYVNDNDLLPSGHPKSEKMNSVFEEGVPHYTEDGELYEGPTHKDESGRLMTGEVHTEDSEYLYHEGEFYGGCWDGYEPIGRKIKDGVSVPNCVPIKTSQEELEEIDDSWGDWEDINDDELIIYIKELLKYYQDKQQ